MQADQDSRAALQLFRRPNDVGPDGAAGNVGYMTFVDWRERSHAFEEMAIIRSWTPTLIANAEPERISAMRVSANFFQTLGARPALGRDFRAEEDTPNGWRVVILSDGLWRRRFNGDQAAIGRVITMNDLQFTIVGVMPPTFEPLISERFATSKACNRSSFASSRRTTHPIP